MKVIELIHDLQDCDPELEVFFRSTHITGNIKSVDVVQKDTYGFFGESIPCVILDWKTEDDK